MPESATPDEPVGPADKDEVMEEIPESYTSKMRQLAGQMNIDEMADAYEIDWPEEGYQPDTTVADGGTVSWGEIDDYQEHPYDAQDFRRMARSRLDDIAKRDPEVGHRYENLSEMVGTPGTKYWDGRLQSEPVAKYSPFELRGRMGNPGFLQELYRQEPVLRNAVDSIVEIQLAADHYIRVPDKEKLEGAGKRKRLLKWSRTFEKALANLERGWDHYIFNAAHSAALFGFAPFELTWRNLEGSPFPKSIEHRDPSTVWRWVLDDRHSEWLGTQFNPFHGSMYTLSHKGPQPQDTKVINPRVAGRALNLEGIAPGRTAAHWLKFKKLLGQIAAAASQKYGVPITYIRVHESMLTLLEQVRGDQDDSPIQEVIDKLDTMQAIEGPAIGLPDGLIADLQSPQGPMPNFLDLIRYCDEQIARCFSHEGSLLGPENAGSYALAEVKDNQFLRSAPAWHRIIMQPINRMMRQLVRQEFGMCRAYPKVGFRLNQAQNTSKLIQTIADLFPPNSSPEQWPEGIQHVVARQFDLESDVFERTDDDPPTGQPQGSPFQYPDRQDTQSRQAGRPPGAQDPRRRGTQQPSSGRPGRTTDQVENMSEHQRRIVQTLRAQKGAPRVDEGEGGEHHTVPEDLDEDEDESEHDEAPHTSGPAPQRGAPRYLQYTEDFQEDFDADTASQTIDRIEENLAKELLEIAERQGDVFEDRTLETESATRLVRQTEEIATSFLDEYEQAFIKAHNHLIKAGMRGLVKEAQLEVPPVLEHAETDEFQEKDEAVDPMEFATPEGMPPLLERHRQALALNATSLSKNLSDRNTRRLRDQRESEIGQDPEDRGALEILALSTLAGIASQAGGRGYNVGRDTLMQAAKDRTTRQTGAEPRIKCVRSTRMDSNVCPSCEQLGFQTGTGGPTFVAGSSNYYANFPPAKCLAGRECRCVMIYRFTDKLRGALQSIIGQTPDAQGRRPDIEVGT